MNKSNYLIPIVVEREGRAERSYDIYSRLLKDRIIFLGDEVTSDLSNVVIAQLLFLANEDSKADVHLYINSPGGSVYSGMGIYDTMQYIQCPVSTYVVGAAASMAAVLFAAGTPGKRFVLPHSRVMIHQPLGGSRGPATDIKIELDEMLRTQDQLYRVLAKHCGKSLDQIAKDCDRNNWMDAEQAVAYGLADKVLESMPESGSPALRSRE
ncbi:MAG: ATP-dependent Clp protease proteolytic subunit [Planctomycetota bacterium]|nr:MAG: ATP-dependent Clp protease proteolytic subunit [Planctomycetota bacterium]